MEIASETAPGGARLDDEISLLGGLDNRDNGKNPAAPQAEKRNPAQAEFDAAIGSHKEPSR